MKMIRPRIRLIAPCVLAAIVGTASIPLQLAMAQMPTAAYAAQANSVTIDPGTGGDDTARIQHAIDQSTGAVVFKAGLYKLSGPLHLKGSRTYIGEGSWDPRYGSVLRQQASGAPIFSVDGQVFSVTIIGLTFDGAPGTDAKGIGAGN